MVDIRQSHRSYSNGPLDPAPGLIPSMGAFEGLTPWGPLFTNVQMWTRQMTQLSASLQHEWLSFIEKRLKEDAALTQQLADCKGPDEIMRTYSGFMRTAFEDYQQEFTTFAKIGGSMAGDALDMMQVEEGELEHLDTKHGRASATSPTARKRPGSAVDTEH